MKKYDISAVVTVRKNSQRVKNKNLRKFYRKNLLIYKIEILKKIKNIKKIIINTDSDEAIKIARKYNVEFHKRDAFFASSKCKNSDFWKHIAQNTKSDYILFTHCTNPLIKVSTYINFIKNFIIKGNKHDSYNSVTEVKEFLYFNKKPINFIPRRAPNSQDLKNVVKLNFALNILKTSEMAKNKSLVGRKPFFYKLNEIEGFDINTTLEFKLAEKLYKEHHKQLMK